MISPNRAARLWLFDFDNTLAALEPEVDWPASRRELEAFLRGEGVDDEIFVEIPKGNLPLYSALHTRWLRPNGAERPACPPRNTAELLLRHSSSIIERYELIGVERALPTPGAIDLLDALAARGATAVIVTSNSSRTVARWLGLHRIGHLVRAIVGRDSLLALKPSPETIGCALDLAGTAAADAVFVGDSEADFGAARAAGIGFYGVAIRESVRDRLVAAGATEVFASPAAMRIHLNLAPPDPNSGIDSN
jgi:phosphoglycolate phosphatase-like HAD superfamily hydrolase